MVATLIFRQNLMNLGTVRVKKDTKQNSTEAFQLNHN